MSAVACGPVTSQAVEWAGSLCVSYSGSSSIGVHKKQGEEVSFCCAYAASSRTF